MHYLRFGSPTPNATAIITCNVHAREFLSAEVCVDMADKLIREQHQILKYFQIIILYVANLERQTALDGDYCLRTNSKGQYFLIKEST